MVKAIEVITNQLPEASDEEFRVDYRPGAWTCPTYAYARDAENPVVVYETSKIEPELRAGIYSRRLNYCTIYVIMEVGFCFIFNDIVYYPSKGDVIIIKNGVEFATYLKQTTFHHYFEIDFPVDFFDKMSENNVFSKLFYDNLTDSPKIVSASHGSLDLIAQILERIKRLTSSGYENTEILTWSYIIQLIDIIYTQKNRDNSYLNAQNIPPKLKNAIEYINGNFINLQTIDEVANYCGITPTYLARMFKKILDTTPNEYVTNLRIAYARHLLNQGKSITDVCYESGFNNYTYFISKFKAITGTTPSKYQKNHL